ncbi:hypothetical protein [Rhizobium sp. NZLR1]|uniref:hypothetical protein n=1 Tax=Rhizobium sp. NZLR1 TaxID=2731096 RepID=UPI001A9865E8|nr:hypothetical protein [Rhizobium sp. NZLR1]MBX5201039.1 hypothetical protein [Rhizobium sp. NZLR1]QSZ21530.1 hypothetical protein J3O30_02885 [Rhizobium sp. NZLR1]
MCATGKNTATRTAGVAAIIVLALLSAAYGAECPRKVETLVDAKEYADCLNDRIAATNNLLSDRIQALLAQIDALKAELNKEITVDDLHVRNTLTVDNDIRQKDIRQVSRYYIGPSGGTAAAVSVWKPQVAPRYGAEFFGWVDYACLSRGGAPSRGTGLVSGWAAEGGPPQYVIDPALANIVAWRSGELIMTTNAYKDCMIVVTHSTPHP